jgi:hypothetical protein
MVNKTELKAENKKLKKRIRRMRKIVKIGLKTIKDRDGKIRQLSSILDQEKKPGVDDLSRKRK